MDYFNIQAIQDYSNHIGKTYSRNSDGANCYYDTRTKLKHLGDLLANKLNISITNNYNERPNKQAGQGIPPVLKEYILTGFIPNTYNVGKSIFIKISFFFNSPKPRFGIEIDTNFKGNNPYNQNRNQLINATSWNIEVDNSFPTNWDDLIELSLPIFREKVSYLNNYFNNQKKMKELKTFIDLLNHKPQIILQGPPGTGKTYEAKNIAEFLIEGKVSDDKKEQAELLKKSDQFELIQFHPSYTYEDFVRGITVNSDNGILSYKTENKVLAKFADKALKASNDKATNISKEEWITEKLSEFSSFVQEEIDNHGKYELNENVAIIDIEEDAFRYIGNKWKGNSHRMRFSDLITLYIEESEHWSKIKKNQSVSGSARQHAAYYAIVLNKFKTNIEEDFIEQSNETNTTSKPYILIIDEINRANLPSVLGELIYALEYRGEAVGDIYAKTKIDRIILPPNLYIIGTMNTADRSVGHIDYAIRRRFAFKSMLPDIKVIEEQTSDTENKKAIDLFKTVEKIFENHLSSDFQKDDVQLGHSYFLGKEEDLEMRLKYEIKPILMEYLKDGIFVESAKAEIEKLAV